MFCIFYGIRPFLLSQNHGYGNSSRLPEKNVSSSEAFRDDLIKDSDSAQFFKVDG
jgi:hypothetical protein